MSEELVELDPDTDLNSIDEEELGIIIMRNRNLPYSLKIERVDGDTVSCRNSWGNHVTYIFKDGRFYLQKELS